MGIYKDCHRLHDSVVEMAEVAFLAMVADSRRAPNNSQPEDMENLLIKGNGALLKLS